MENLLKMEKELSDIREKQAKAEEQHRTIFRRLDKQDEMIESVHQLATSVGILAKNQERIEKNVEGMRKDVDEIKIKPAKRWDGLVQNLIYAFGGALVAYIATRLRLG